VNKLYQPLVRNPFWEIEVSGSVERLCLSSSCRRLVSPISFAHFRYPGLIYDLARLSRRLEISFSRVACTAHLPSSFGRLCDQRLPTLRVPLGLFL
jgi:hypothetical protein